MPTYGPYPEPIYPIQPFGIQPADPYGYLKPLYTPPRFIVPNKRVAVEPFPEVAKAAVRGGVIEPMNLAALTPLKVVFGGGGYWVGQTAYVRSNLRNTTTYAKEVLEVNGQKFILLPEEQVVLVDNGPEPLLSITATSTPTP